MINLRKANYIYNQKIKNHFKRLKCKKDLLKRKPHLAICNYFDRYPNEYSIFSLETIFNLGYRDKNFDNNLKYSLDKSQKFAYSFGKLLRGKSKVLNIKLIPLFLFLLKFILKFCYSILDLVVTIFYSFYYVNFLRNNKLLFLNLNRINKKNNLYTINYWKTKQLNSVKYYYPDLELDKNNYFLATEFFQNRSIFQGLRIFHSNKNKYFLSALDFVSNKDICFVILLLLDSYVFDFLGKHRYSYGIIASNILKISSLNRNYLYLLNYKCGQTIIKKIGFKNIYIWFENQSDTKMFLIGLKNTKIKSKKSNIISYFGCTSFSANYHKQLLPNQFELDIGIWGDYKFMMPDQKSLEEIKDYLKLNFTKNKFKLKKVRKGLRRFKDINIDLDNSLAAKKRKFTYITHGTQKELFQVFLALFYSPNNFRKMIRNNSLYIRLHPSIDEKNISYEINFLKKIFTKEMRFPRLIFIDTNKENLLETINKSEYLIFGNSSLINIALSQNRKVISVRTSFLYGEPIQRIYQNKNNLFKI